VSEIKEVELERLVLDPKNPRLPESVKRDDPSILEYIASTTALEDLMEAIGENDFFPGEPIVVVPENEAFVVIEGNRRLTAVRLLSNPELYKNASKRMLEIAANAKFKPKTLPVVEKATRDQVLPYLGFRHITGVKQWEPLAKARYIFQLFELQPEHLNAQERYAAVAKSIGSRRDHIKRNLDALAVYRAIESEDFFDIKDLNEATIRFAVLSTALADERIAGFVGVSKPGAHGQEPSNPIVHPDALRAKELKELSQWLYEEDEDGQTRVGESRNLRQLAAVIDSPKALAAFRNNATLSYAYRLTRGVNQDLMEFLYEAENSLNRAAGLIANVEFSDDAFSLVKQLRETINLLGKTLKDKQGADDGF
jgi:hypothetical protein